MAILISPYAVHRRAELWPDPGSFVPARFLAGRRMPSGGGPRKCIGGQFALIEATLIMALVIQQYEIHPLGTDAGRRDVPGRST